MKASNLLYVACALFVMPIAYGYSIAPKDNVHERMTAAAKRCYDAAVAADAAPSACSTDIKKSMPDMTWIPGGYPSLEKAVRWPDDPTRQITPTMGATALATMLVKCNRLAKDRSPADNNLNDGLLCNSHYGSMQFFHAQASTVGEAASVTHEKIMKWAEFLYTVASGDHPAGALDTTYCQYFAARDAFGTAMRPDIETIPCNPPEGMPAWDVTTLFTMKCTNPISARVCNDEPEERRLNVARMHATGALLHLIQDSYSQSHCVRGECDELNGVQKGKAVAKVECKPIRMFTTYRGQKKHSDADKAPDFASSCNAQADIYDPVTASAKMLWHIRKRSGMAAVKADLERVFGSAASVASNPGAGMGKCFEGK